MAKVFTITEGLENLGALKTGGQGSVYKGKRIGEIFTAIKIIPTPVSSESEMDKNYVSFRNEVEKLKKVNEDPSPNVVKILNSGITDSGNFPFIEMEYIEGPDLGELITSPHESVFTLKETIKVAEHLSNALAHCHTVNVKHGDIKSNNVKFNKATGNYILLDFGLSVMSDEQRRTSLRHAGAIEFMAPEQTEGRLLFESDIYSFGIIIYELLAGRVPFPLKDNSESARNAVVVAHIETLPHDLSQLRQENLPASWSDEKKKSEMQVPAWLLNVVTKCLQKDPANRFSNGMQLQDFIHNQSLANATMSTASSGGDAQRLNSELQTYQNIIHQKDEEINHLRNALSQQGNAGYSQGTGISKALFFSLLVITLGLAAYAGYTLLNKRSSQTTEISTTSPINMDSLANDLGAHDKPYTQEDIKEDSTYVFPDDNNQLPVNDQDNDQNTDSVKNTNPDNTNTTTTTNNDYEKPVVTDPDGKGKKYKISGIAYLYDKPETSARTGAFISSASSATLTALEDREGYIYVEFTSQNGEPTKAWINKKDLRQVDD